ncbi:MAG: glycosyl hydrolase family 18 protein [Candidatus Dormibacteraeota bacterium]|nr:glycosyl hydrolase family 18 protein [Candidatus Dormibacteraeota bacterium]
MNAQVRARFGMFVAVGGCIASVGAANAQGSTPTQGEPMRAHVMFDDSTGPWRDGIPVGGRPAPLHQARTRVSDPRSATAPLSPAKASTSTRPDPEVLGFAQSGEVTSGAWRQDLRTDLLSTIAYFGVNMNGDGSLVTRDSGYQGWWSAQTTSMIDAAHSAGDRVVLTVKAFDNATIAAITGTAQSRQNAVNTMVAEVLNRGADGVNLDFEGTDSSVAANFTAFVSSVYTGLRSAAPAQAYLTVDAYASAARGGTMYDVRGLSAHVDAFDVMAYDITSAGSAQAGPVAPLNGMTYADTNTVASFLSIVAPSQVILGVPYYGYKWSTTSNQPQAQTIGHGSADTYSGGLADFQCAQQLTQSWDGTFASPWASWYSPATGDPCGGDYGSWRELYYENAASLGMKYDLVNSQHLRGIGIWALGYDSGHQELWDEIASKFVVTHAPAPQMTPLPSVEGSTSFALGWSVPSGSPSVSSYVVYVEDGASGWQTWTRTTATAADFFGFPGHTYRFFVEAFVAGGYSSGGPNAAAMASTTVGNAASHAQPFAALYAVDGYGNLHPASSPPQPPGTLFPSWDMARGLTVEPSGRGGLVLDGWGGLHPFGDSAAPVSPTYWFGWDIARAVAALPGGVGGYVLDGWGGIHPYAVGGSSLTTHPRATGYWPGWDIARGLAVFADGSGGLVLDGWGGLHPFTNSGSVASALVTGYWNGWDIARGLVLLPNSSASSYAGYVLDGWGGLHPFASQGRDLPPIPRASGYWSGQDVAHGVVLIPGTTMGYVVDSLGAFWPFGGASPVETPNYGLGGRTVRSPSAA